MRTSLATGLLILACGPLLASGPAAAFDSVTLPDYFAASWETVAANPLTVFPGGEGHHPTVAMARPEVPQPPTALDRAALPSIIVAGVPTPPPRPQLVPGVAAYASLAPDVGLPQLPRLDIPLPVPRPGGIDAAAAAPSPEPQQPQTQVAMLGGMPGAGMAIAALARMEPLPPVVKGACSVTQPYKLTALGPNARTALTPAATLDYPMIDHLVRWEAEMQAAARRNLGEPVAVIRVAASYDCRTMNHRARARLSEHAHANAVDIASYITASGREITVHRDFYDKGKDGAFLREVHSDTCDIFQVVLGPGSDGMHEDHFHMDLGKWKACR